MEQLEKSIFDVLVVGGGHAGLEAAWAASQFGLKVGIVSMPEVPLGSTPCNPAVGGVGKGQVVREIDALGGLMGRVADLSGLQYRTLNTSKGHAVRSTRVQVDKELYSHHATRIIESSDITVIRVKIESIAKSEEGLFEVLGPKTERYRSKKIVVTTGTFLGGKLHTGSQVSLGGRVECSPSRGLEDLFSGIKKSPVRFKTGTPPRIARKTIDFSKLEEQESDSSALNFHFEHDPFRRFSPQHSCFLTRTSEATLEMIRSNKEKSPMYNGQIKAVGPRYCPSIEDKAFRYPDRNEHHVFLEPEGVESESFYPNGISTSLPVEIQRDFLRTIPGLEHCEILVPGYAVEYDIVETTQLNSGLEHRDVNGLYFAGQVNGTSGYEEAAGQGLVAGMNAALALLGRSKFELSRYDSYIGVMVDDLISTSRDEPYRLFTARSENRLYVREDNAFVRMAPYRLGLNLDYRIDAFLKESLEQHQILSDLLDEKRYRENTKTKKYFDDRGYGALIPNMTLSDLIRRSSVAPDEILKHELYEMGTVFHPMVVRSCALSTKYAGYIDRARIEEEKLKRLDQQRVDLKKILNNRHISHECRQRLEAIGPKTFGEVKRITGIRPATVAFIAGSLGR